MSAGNGDPTHEGAPSGSAALAAETVRAELGRILSGPEFRSSKRCQAFLRYVVENTLAGHPECLKERTIGMEVFGRSASYEPSEDATVRVIAGDVRKRLDLFYRDPASGGPVTIRLPAGSYVPEFHPQATPPSTSPAPSLPATPSRASSFPSSTRRVAMAVLALAAVFAFALLRGRRTTTAFDAFWAPVLSDAKPVSLCAAAVPVWARLREPPAGEAGSAADFTVIRNQFMALGDVKAALQVAEMLGRTGHPYRLRMGNETSFKDLRATPAILVGFSYTEWAQISKGFRYYIDIDRRPMGVFDKGNPTAWTIDRHPDDPQLTEDYAIATRVFDPNTHNMLVEIAGISHFGTEAAADLVSNSALLTEALARVPAGWEHKNVQLVLRVKVIAGAAGVPAVVATHVW
jgi:hypothetical protein